MLPLAMTSGSNFYSQPTLSIITPILNAARPFSQTLKSLANLPNLGIPFEHIVVDSSPVEHDALFHQFADRTFQRIHQKPQGIYPAFELGRSISKGEFLWFLNAGDLLCDAKALARMISDLIQNPSTDAIVGGASLWRGNEFLYEKLPGSNIAKQIAAGFIPCHQAMVYRKNVFDRVGGFRTDLKIASDVDHHLRMVEAGARFMTTSEIVIRYDVNGASADMARFQELAQIAHGKSWKLKARYSFNQFRNLAARRFPSPRLSKAWHLVRRALG